MRNKKKQDKIIVTVPLAKHNVYEYFYVAEAILKDGYYQIANESAKAIKGIVKGRPY
jgi:hypothetical protein